MSRRHVLHAVALVVGATALAILIDQLGWEGIESALVSAGPWFAVLALFDLAGLLCDAAGVYTFVRPLAPNSPIAYRHVLAAQASGIAINRLTPGNSLGEPIKVTMLMQYVPEAAAVSAVVMFNVAMYVVAMTVIIIGVPLTLLMMDLPDHVQLLVALLAIGLAAVILGLLVLAKRGPIASAIRGLRRIRLVSAARSERWQKRIAEIDANVKRFGDATTRRAFVFVIASRAFNLVGTVGVLIAAGIPLTAPLVIGMLSVGILITWASNVIPLGLGLADGGNYMLSGALGSAPGAGIAFTMVNRVRTMLLATMGLAIMAIANLTARGRPSTHRRAS